MKNAWNTELYRLSCEFSHQSLSFILQAWIKVLESFSSHYHRHRQAVRSLATLDALVALSSVAKSQGYCRPSLSAKGNGGARLKIVQGRHPVVSQIQSGDDQYVANDTNMEVSGCVWFASRQ